MRLSVWAFCPWILLGSLILFLNIEKRFWYYFTGIVHCAISTEEKITIAVKHGHNIKQVAMSNHTACHCACLPKKCHRKQRFDADLCECVCIYNGERECNEKTNKQWDRHSCQCVCSIKSLDCDFDKTWNNDSCTCESAVDNTVA